jgi:hypothetical protein
MMNYILREIKKRKNKKKGISEMISYVLLMSIVTFISVGVYLWVRSLADVTPSITCPEDTSLRLSSYQCGDKTINFTLENNGRFTIDGVVLRVTNSTLREPLISLVTNGNSLNDISYQDIGYYSFNLTGGLIPSKSINATFKNQRLIKKLGGGIEPQMLMFNDIKKISIQPFIFDENDVPILCTAAKINPEIENCNF